MKKVYLLTLEDYESATIECVSLSKKQALDLGHEFVKRWNSMHTESCQMKPVEITYSRDFTITLDEDATLLNKWRAEDNTLGIIEMSTNKLNIEDIK